MSGVPPGCFLKLLLTSEGSELGASLQVWWFHIKDW